MPKNRKYFPHKSVLFITTRTEEGLPLPPNHVVSAILWGILAEARSRYDVRICHLAFMSNHLHLILVVNNPEHVSSFMRYLKSESSHAVNRLLGRRKKTIWSAGYDSPILLTPERVVHYARYIYLNPSRAGLVESIDEYPGVSSWSMFLNKRPVSQHARIPRPLLKPLSSPALSISEQRRLVSGWERLELEKKSFLLEPWAWVECFPGVNIEETRDSIIAGVREAELGYRQERLAVGKRVLGATALRRQSMTKEHVPTQRSRRMVVLCENKKLRKQFLEHFKSLCDLAAAAYKSWKRGDLLVRIPAGMFSPRVPTLVSALQL